jgi:hypothetical protein
MKTIETHGTFEEAIGEATEDVQALARDVRALIADIYPQVTEVPWPRQQITGYGLGPKKMSEHFCYIGAHAAHVNLGFNYGADLPDPEGLLEGTGKKFRHIKITQIEQIRQAGLRQLIIAAIEERERALGRTRAS